MNQNQEIFRVEALRRLEILDSPRESEFDDLVSMASDFCDVPMSAICLVDEARIWLKASHGISSSHFPRQHSFCDIAIQSDLPLIVRDASRDSRFNNHSMVVENPRIRSYVGFPILLKNGLRLGTLSVFDVVPRDLRPRQLRILGSLARQCSRLIEYQALAKGRHPQQTNRTDSAFVDIAARIAHEIRNPLEVIVGRAERIFNLSRQKNCPSETIGHNALEIERTGIYVGEIVRSILAIARDGDPGPVKEIPVGEIFRSLIDSSNQRIQSHGIRLSVSAPPDLTIRCQPIPLIQSVLNLVNNSIDAVIPLKDRWISVECKRGENGTEIVVTDSGNGIPQEIQQNLAKPFFTTKPRGQGTGLGLLMAKNFVEAQGGKLKHDPTFERTRFRIWIPG